MLTETLDQLRSCEESFYGARREGRLVGFVSWKIEADTLDIHRLAVDPADARRGVGRELVRRAIKVGEVASRVVVSTGTENVPAVALYKSLGLRATGTREIAKGVTVTSFELG